MSLINNVDKIGRYFKFGTHGKKYYYASYMKESREETKEKAKIQGRAEHGKIKWTKKSRKII